MKYTSFTPPNRTLLGPGPSDVPQRILDAMARPTVGHLDPSFIGLMDEIKALLQYAFQTENALTMPVSAPGTAGMQTCVDNLIEPGDTAIVCINGVFGIRIKEMILRAGGKVITVENDWGTPVDPNKLDETLKQSPEVKLVAFVHAETSTGVLSDAKTLSEIAHKHDCLTLVDAVTSLGGSPLKVDEWQLDAVYSGTQKCLSCTPGLSPITFSDRAVEAIKNRKTKVNSWFLDLNLVMAYWGTGAKRAYHHTAPVNALYGLHESLIILHNEGLENAWARHQANHIILRDKLEALGFKFLVDAAYRLPQLNAVIPPAGVDEAGLRKTLLEKYSIEVGGGLGALAGKIWRIGLMGHSSRQENIDQLINALQNSL